MSARNEIKFSIDCDLKARILENRKENVKKFYSLFDESLEFGVKERRLYLYKTRENEKICIQYPGKETKNKTKKRPFDFRPIVLDDNGNKLNNQKLEDIWTQIEKLKKWRKPFLEFFAALLLRCNALIDSEYEEKKYYCEDLDMTNNERVIDSKTITFKYHRLIIKPCFLDYINKKISKMNEFSVEAYLLMNELICQNEDCKYSFGDEKWSGKSGREATYQTHVSFIEYLENNKTLPQLLGKFSNGRGVARVNEKDISNITNGLVSVKRKKNSNT